PKATGRQSKVGEQAASKARQQAAASILDMLPNMRVSRPCPGPARRPRGGGRPSAALYVPMIGTGDQERAADAAKIPSIQTNPVPIHHEPGLGKARPSGGAT